MSDCTEVAAVRAITVPFHGAELFVVEHNGQPYTPMKPIVTAMGLDWGSQFRKVASNEARWGIVNLTIPSEGGDQAMTCLPVRKTAAWLTTIEPGKVKNPDVRARVIQYQNECDEVLWQYWNDGVAVNPRALYAVNPGDVLSKDEAETLRLMLKAAVDRLPKHMQGKMMLQGWSKLKAHFKVPYREIPRHEFSEAVSIISRHTTEWELVDDAPKEGTLNEIVADWVKKLEEPNGYGFIPFIPLVEVVQRKMGYKLAKQAPAATPLLPEAQAKEIADRLGRLSQLFHPFSEQAADVVGIQRALRGIHPQLGVREDGYQPVLK